MSGHSLSHRARDDLDGIWGHTVSQWGEDQAEHYLRMIGEAFALIAADPRRGPDCGHIRAGYRKYRTGSHVIFYRIAGSGVDVVRILHGRMDFERRV